MSILGPAVVNQHSFKLAKYMVKMIHGGTSLAEVHALLNTLVNFFVITNTDDDNGTVTTFVTGSHDGTALLWQWDRATNAVECSHTCRGHAGSVDCLGTNTNNTRVSGSDVISRSMYGNTC